MNIKIFITILIAAFFTTACSDDFLDKQPKGTLGKSVERATGEDVFRLLIAAYSGLDMNVDGAGWYPRHSGFNWILGDMRTDDAVRGSHRSDQSPLIDVEKYRVQTTNDISKGEWKRGYVNIQRTNDVINYANNAVNNDDNFDETDKNQSIAEARFLRGHYYFNLKIWFGNIPWISEDTEDYYVSNRAGQDIWGKIEADFQFAIDNLPEEQNDVGRATKWAAKAYMAKVHMQQQDYSAAKPLLDDIIDNGPFSLANDYESNFRVSGNNNEESVFSIQHALDEQTMGQNGNMGLAFVGSSAIYGCCGFYQPTHDLVNAYLTDEDGLPMPDTYRDMALTSDIYIPSSDNWIPGETYEEGQVVTRIDSSDDARIERVYEVIVPNTTGDPLTSGDWEMIWKEPSFDYNIDPRLDFSVGRRGVPYMDWGYHEGSNWIRDQSTAGPYLAKKYLYNEEEKDAGYVNSNGWNANQNAINYRLIRYAEVLLWAAEAEVEIGSLEKAREYVNMIRGRMANNPEHWVKEFEEGSETSENAANYVIGLYNDPWADKATARKAVRFERRLELAMEGKRWYDLVRWGEAADILNSFVNYEGQFFNGDDYLYEDVFFEAGVDELLPINRDYIDASVVSSDTTLIQNPGY